MTDKINKNFEIIANWASSSFFQLNKEKYI